MECNELRKIDTKNRTYMILMSQSNYLDLDISSDENYTKTF